NECFDLITQGIGAVEDGLSVSLLACSQRSDDFHQQQFGIAIDGGQGVAQVVTHIRRNVLNRGTFKLGVKVDKLLGIRENFFYKINLFIVQSAVLIGEKILG